MTETSVSFKTLGLDSSLVQALDGLGYSKPTPIQAQAIPHLLEGKDLCGIAQTGTGKTAAFALPSIHYLATNPQARPQRGCRMLILSPTRELASQIARACIDYTRHLRMSVNAVFGGVPIGRQMRMLDRGTDILVATPGRLLDLIDQRALVLKDVEVFVLDEADQMLDLGFIHALRRIDKLLPKNRQTLFFSATMPKTIQELSSQFLSDPVTVSVAPQSSTAERVEQFGIFVNQSEKQALLTITLKNTPGLDRALVFTRTKHGADRVVRHLEAAGLPAAAIHGNKSQPQRERALNAFRNGRLKILVATDIAARGIDVPGVSHVFNYELPNVAEQYVHRIGRTARAGRDGQAISFIANDERSYLRSIERLTRVKLQILPLPENFVMEKELLPHPAPMRPERDGRDGRGGRGGGRGRFGGGAKPSFNHSHGKGDDRGDRGGERPRRPRRPQMRGVRAVARS